MAESYFAGKPGTIDDVAIRILLVDDHQIVRDGLRALLRSQEDFELVGEAENGRTAVTLADTHHPDVVLMDLSMPELNGVDATRQLEAAHPATRVLILSAHADQTIAIDAMRVGATGLLPKVAAFEELAAAIRTVVSGKVYLSPQIKGRTLDAIQRNTSQGDGSAADNLTPREREVLQLIAEGNPTKRIAQILSLSVKTVETYRRQIMEKLALDNVAELTRYAVRQGLTTL